MAAVLVAGCGGDTGILIEVTRDPKTTPAAIDHLQFYVGVAAPTSGTSTAAAQGYVADTAPGDRASVSGRDLAKDPYRLMLRPGQVSGATALVAVVALKSGRQVGFGSISTPVGFQTGKVFRWVVTVSGDQQGHVSDTGCVTWRTEGGGSLQIASPNDQDCDGDPASVDCNDHNPNVGPSKPEICNNGIDDNCNGKIDESVDADGDGWTNCAGDCDDTDPTVYPGAPEICDGKDNDCNGRCDDGFDQDGDHYTTCGTIINDDGTCKSGGPDPSLVDCDDNDAEVHPGAQEVCNGKDDNCNGQCDEGFDPDGDTYTECGSRTDVCNGTSDSDIDCAPDDPDVHPGAQEICDGKDDNCDGKYFPAQTPCYATDGTGVCRVGTRTCDDQHGGGYTSGCQVTSSDQVVDPGLCQAYSQCEQAGAPDPYVCANTKATATSVPCQLAYQNANGELCANANVVLPSSTSDMNCAWALPKGKNQAHYDVHLFGSGGDGAVVKSCDASLAVDQALDQPPQPDAFLVSHAANGQTQLFRLVVTPTASSVCPQQALTCNFPVAGP